MLKVFVDAVYRRSPLQKKRLEPYLASADADFWTRANSFASAFEAYLQSVGLDVDYAVDAYLKMCADMLTEQTRFLKSGVYSRANQGDAFQHVYSDDCEMRSYMVGLALSQFLWETHYGMYTFFLQTLERRRDTVRRYLEIGPGHGMFLAAALGHFGVADYTAIDISPTSLDVSKGLLPFIAPGAPPAVFRLLDVMDLDRSESFDFITMGEVIEHLDDPRPILRTIRALLATEGRAFLTTCANCPAIDHVYLFRSVPEIRALIRSCGFAIEDERVLPVEKLPAEDLARFRVTINYAAIVRAS
jgi:2-polyprenyl-3-methyl-5-hydroxy-6-metoxy-1,4-benzoquinol methylase